MIVKEQQIPKFNFHVKVYDILCQCDQIVKKCTNLTLIQSVKSNYCKWIDYHIVEHWCETGKKNSKLQNFSNKIHPSALGFEPEVSCMEYLNANH